LLVWKIRLGESESRIALEKDSLEVWVNGEKIETEAGFTDEGGDQRTKTDGSGYWRSVDPWMKDQK